MSEWASASLSDVAEIRISNVDKKNLPGERAVRLCNYMDVYENDYITAHLPFMEATATSEEIARFLVNKGDVLLTKDSETPDDIGIPAVVVDDIPDLVCGYHLALIKPDPNRTCPPFLAKQLGAWPTAKRLARLANGSTRYGLSFSAIASTRLLLPPLPQQRRIAEVLSALDETIEQAETLIAKHQQIKAGLMHDLFARGLAPNGSLCPASESQRTTFGWIPRTWHVGSLLDVSDQSRQPILTGPFGADLGNEDFIAEGVPVLRIGNIQQGYLDLSDLLFVTPHKARVSIGIVFARATSYLHARELLLEEMHWPAKPLRDISSTITSLEWLLIRVGVHPSSLRPHSMGKSSNVKSSAKKGGVPERESIQLN